MLAAVWLGLGACRPPSVVDVIVVEGSDDSDDIDGDADDVEPDPGSDTGGEGEGESPDDTTEAPGGEGESPPGPARYRQGVDHSPLTPLVIERLRSIRAAHPELSDDVFAKVGDSLTVSTSYLHCLATTALALPEQESLEGTRASLAGGDAAGSDPFRRVSMAATVGWSASAPLVGQPPPLEQELDALSPAWATVMFGTNDIQRGSIARYGEDMLVLVDTLLARGVIPLLSTIPPRGDSGSADAQVPRYNLVVRALAEARQIPLIDLERRLRALPDFGLGQDDIHLNRDSRGACTFDDEGLRHGYNFRNLLVLQALDRLRRSVVEGGPAPDPDDELPSGDGSIASPFVVDALPFTASTDTSQSPHDTIDRYPACSQADESGPEVVYRLVLDVPTRVRVFVIDAGDTDVDIHHLDTNGECTARDDDEIIVDLPAGAHTFVVDTYQGDTHAGQALVVFDVP